MSAKQGARYVARQVDPDRLKKVLTEALVDKPFLHRIGDIVDAAYRQTAYHDDVKQGRKGTIIGHLPFEGLQRDLGANVGSAGGFTSKSSSPTTLAEALVARTVCDRAGAQFRRPEGDWSPIPRRATPATAYYVEADGTASGETTGTFGSAAVSVKEVAANVDFTRLLGVQTGGLVESMLLDELTRVLAAGVDAGALCGSGVSSEPTGVLNHPNVGSVSGTGLAWTGILEMLRLVEVANAEPTAWVCAPDVAKILRGRQRFTGVDSPILGPDGTINGIPCYVTTSMDDGGIVVGDFRHLLILNENLELLVNPFTQSKAQIVEVTAIQFFDVAVLHGGAFCKSTSVT